jgi:hypothetical protein
VGPPPDESGNESLPPAQEEAQATQAPAQEGAPQEAEDEEDSSGEEEEDYDEEEPYDPDDEDEGDEPAFTDQDRTDLVKLEDDAKSAGLVQAMALKEIRQRQLWKSIKDEEGKRRYHRFEDYCAERLGHTKQWVTQQTRWLAMVELLDALEDCGTFKGTLHEKQEQGLVAVVQEAVSDGLTLTGKHLGSVCQRRSAYFGASGGDKPAAPTYPDYKDDCKMLEEIAGMSWDWNIPGIVVKEQQESGASYAEAVGKVYLQEGKRPKNSALLHHGTGDDLRAVVDQLLVARKKREAVEKAKADKAEANRKAREAREAEETALAQAGIAKPAKRKGKGKDGNGGQGGDNGRDGDQDEDVQVEIHYRLKMTPPAVNPDAWDFEDWDKLLDKLTELKDEHEPKEPGGIFLSGERVRRS